MKHLRKFENWTTDTTGNYDINYGDKIDSFDVVENVKKYIIDNFDEIKNFRNTNMQDIIVFNYNNELISIKLSQDNDGYNDTYMIEFIFKNLKKSKNIDLTKEEMYELLSFFDEIKMKKMKKDRENDLTDVLDEIVPIRKAAKKYNI